MMLSSTLPLPRTLSLPKLIPRIHVKPNLISATATPSRPPPSQLHKDLYQPFRPPPSPIPEKFRGLDTAGRLEILTNRLGMWYEYAPLLPTLISEGYSPSNIEEITGMSSVDQNRIVVAAKVRETLVESGADEEIINFFEGGGAEVLYEIRLLSSSQRIAAAEFMVKNNMDGKGAQELARAVKDFPRRRGEKGWESFNYTLPADCLSFMYYRQALENTDRPEERSAMLKEALEIAGSEAAKARISEDLEGKSKGVAEIEAEVVRVPLVRMKVGEVAEATQVVVLPACRGEEGEKEVEAAPWEIEKEGEFGVVAVGKGWSRWVVLPGWQPILGLNKGGVAVEFSDARVLPWRVNTWYKDEPVLVIADRGRNDVAASNGFYLVVESSGLRVERGAVLKEKGVDACLGTVVLVVRPPREETDDQLSEEDWQVK